MREDYRRCQASGDKAEKRPTETSARYVFFVFMHVLLKELKMPQCILLMFHAVN